MLPPASAGWLVPPAVPDPSGTQPVWACRELQRGLWGLPFRPRPSRALPLPPAPTFTWKAAQRPWLSLGLREPSDGRGTRPAEPSQPAARLSPVCLLISARNTALPLGAWVLLRSASAGCQKGRPWHDSGAGRVAERESGDLGGGPKHNGLPASLNLSFAKRSVSNVSRVSASNPPHKRGNMFRIRGDCPRETTDLLAHRVILDSNVTATQILGLP